jgi:hypothetical protein
MLDGPALTFTGVRLTGLIVKSFFFLTLDLGMCTFANLPAVLVHHETNAA